jgi:hypothetical protein
VVCVKCKRQHLAGSKEVAIGEGWLIDAQAKTDPPTYICPECQRAALPRR